MEELLGADGMVGFSATGKKGHNTDEEAKPMIDKSVKKFMEGMHKIVL